MVCYSLVYFSSIISHIFLYVFRSVNPKKETGMVWRLPHLGQVTGWEYAVACHSMSRASKTWPQSSHLNFVFPRIMVSEVSRLCFGAYHVNVQRVSFSQCERFDSLSQCGRRFQFCTLCATKVLIFKQTAKFLSAFFHLQSYFFRINGLAWLSPLICYIHDCCKVGVHNI